MHEWVTTTYSLFSSFNNGENVFISFIIDPRDLRFENHLREIIWLASFGGIVFDLLTLSSRLNGDVGTFNALYLKVIFHNSLTSILNM